MFSWPLLAKLLALFLATKRQGGVLLAVDMRTGIGSVETGHIGGASQSLVVMIVTIFAISNKYFIYLCDKFYLIFNT